jgi:hypothetical protein
MIKPTVGRVVWFTPSIYARDHAPLDPRQPLAAIVAYVWHDRMINVAFFDQNGVAHNATSVTLLQDDDLKPEHGYFASWMPYQKGQAAKTEALETAAAARAAEPSSF